MQNIRKNTIASQAFYELVLSDRRKLSAIDGVTNVEIESLVEDKSLEVLE